MVSYDQSSISYNPNRGSYRRLYARNRRTGGLVPVFRVSEYVLGRGVLGATNCVDKVWIKEGLDPYTEEKVIKHEEAHIADPFAPEMEIRRRTNTVYI